MVVGATASTEPSWLAISEGGRHDPVGTQPARYVRQLNERARLRAVLPSVHARAAQVGPLMANGHSVGGGPTDVSRQVVRSANDYIISSAPT